MSHADHILTFTQYAAVRHPTPYLIDVDQHGARLLLFGSQHSSDPANPMFAQIQRIFTELAPGFALHEGTPPAIEPEREIAIRRHGEAGLVRHLATRAGIETDSMDIPLAEEARLLCNEITVSETLVFLVVRQLASFNRKTARMDFDAYFGEFFELIAPALELKAIDWPLVGREHIRVMGHRLTPPEVTGHETNPMMDALPTQRIARRSNRLRDEHMLRRLLGAMQQHRRVFATVGVSHAVMLEPALRAGAQNHENTK